MYVHLFEIVSDTDALFVFFVFLTGPGRFWRRGWWLHWGWHLCQLRSIQRWVELGSCHMHYDDAPSSPSISSLPPSLSPMCSHVSNSLPLTLLFQPAVKLGIPHPDSVVESRLVQHPFTAFWWSWYLIIACFYTCTLSVEKQVKY